jgi:hypothetical protein
VARSRETARRPRLAHQLDLLFEPWVHQLSEHEKEALRLYQHGGHRCVNPILWRAAGGPAYNAGARLDAVVAQLEHTEREEFLLLYGLLSSAIEKGYGVAPGLSVWRGCNTYKLPFDGWPPPRGLTGVVQGFMSTSLSEDVAVAYANPEDGEPCLIRVVVRPGHPVAWMPKVSERSVHADQFEVLFLAGRRLQVTSFEPAGPAQLPVIHTDLIEERP